MKTPFRIFAVIAGFCWFQQMRAQSSPVLPQPLPNYLQFNNIEVLQQSLFRGEIRLADSLWIYGDARLKNNLTAAGALNVAGNVVFSGLSAAQDPESLLNINPDGELTSLPLMVLAQT